MVGEVVGPSSIALHGSVVTVLLGYCLLLRYSLAMNTTIIPAIALAFFLSIPCAAETSKKPENCYKDKATWQQRYELLDKHPQGKHLFILSGQSNMEGMHYEIDFNPFINQAFGKENVIVVWDAKGGEPISRWYKGWKSSSGNTVAITGDLYDRLITKVKEAIIGQRIKTVTFIWMQGETDALNGDGDVYQKSMIGLFNQIKTDMNRHDINVIIGRISDYDLDNKKFQDWTMVRNIQVKVAESYPRGAWINTDDLNDGLSRDGIIVNNDLHYSKHGYEVLGKRFAEKAIDMIKKQN